MHGRADRVATLGLLRKRMDAVPSRLGGEGAARTVAEEVLPVPGPLGELLPDGGLARGRVVGCPRGSLLCALLAAATGTGLHAAIVGGLRPTRINVGAAAEMGADLQRIALIDAGSQAAEVMSVLADGIAVIVLDDPAVRLAPRQEEGLRGRLRDKGTVLITTGEFGIRQPYLDIAATHIADHGLGQGSGRIQGFDLDVRVSRQGRPYRHGRIALVGRLGGGTHWHTTQPEAKPGTEPGLAFTG